MTQKRKIIIGFLAAAAIGITVYLATKKKKIIQGEAPNPANGSSDDSDKVITKNDPIKIDTAKAISPPDKKLKKIPAYKFLYSGGDIKGKYLWAAVQPTRLFNTPDKTNAAFTVQKGISLGLAVSADMTKDGNYMIKYIPINDASKRLYVLSSSVNLGIY